MQSATFSTDSRSSPLSVIRSNRPETPNHATTDDSQNTTEILKEELSCPPKALDSPVPPNTPNTTYSTSSPRVADPLKPWLQQTPEVVITGPRVSLDPQSIDVKLDEKSGDLLISLNNNGTGQDINTYLQKFESSFVT